MSANDQRPKGQPSQVSNGSGSKEEDAYLQQQPPHPMRAWSEQASDGAYGAGPMSTAVSDSFFPNYYPPNMSYPFMSQGMGGSEGAWSSGADTMFGMGYDYGGNMYSGFGFPFNNWDYSDYWGSTQPVRKDQRGYPTEDAYYPPEMIPADSYGMVNGGAPPPDTQEPVANVEQGIRNMRLAYGKEDTMQQPPQQHLPQVVAEGFSGDPSLMMPPSPVSASAPSMNIGNSGGSMGSQSGQSSKKTSWAAIASQPARPQLQMRPRTIPRAPVHPNKTHNMDIGTWDTRGNPSRVPMTMSQPLPSQPPPPLARNSRPPLISQRQTVSPSTSVTVYNSSNNNSGNNNSTNSNSSSSYGNPVEVNSAVSTNVTHSTSNNDISVVNDSSSNASNNMPNSGSGGNSPYSGHPSSSSGNLDSNNRTVVATSASVNGTHGEPQAATSNDSGSSEKSQPSAFYNPKEFVLNHKSARYFIIKSYSEDDIHRSIKYAVWCSTEHGNRRLDAAFVEREGKGPVYLIFSVNGSGHFCGVAQMMSSVDYSTSSGIWHQDKWKGQIEVKWVYVKDVPNNQLRHIRLENNDNKPVTNSRDTQEVPPEKGKQVLRIMHSFKHSTSIFDDFPHYEKRQEEDRMMSMYKDNRSGGGGDREHHSGGQQQHHHRDNNRGGDRENRGDRDNRGGGGERRENHYNRGGGGNHYHRNDRNDFNRGEGRDGRDHRYDNRGGDNRNDNRNDNKEHGGRGGFDREIRGRPGDMNDRDNRRGGHHRQY